ncbi:MAG TPA: apolipoprotein N-acyltransferase [Actinocrinis sp.]|nr:apolipoprotein N-acyltransferase [Actinocrinis sp.]
MTAWRPSIRRPHPGRHWLPQLAAAGFGALMVLAFAPIGWYWLTPLCVAGYTLSARAAAASREARGLRRPAKAAAWTGLWFGLAFCVLMFKWVTVVGTDAWIILGILEALYFIPFGAATAAVARLRGAVLWQALLWVAVEAARDRWPVGGFSWGRLAFSQTHTVLTPLAALGGAPLVTFATALVGTLLAAAALAAYRTARGSVAPRAVWTWSLAGWTLLAVALPAAGWLVPLQTTAGKPVELAAIQGNVPRTGLDAYGQAAAVLDNHLAVTAQYAAEVAAGKVPKPTAVIWPEDSDDVDPFTDPGVYAQLTAAAQGVGTQILVGTVVDAGPGHARNEGIVWDPVTGAGQTYVKRHLVPMGEYVPFESTLRKYISELALVPRSYVPGSKPGVLTVGGVRIAEVICFEVAYDDMVRSSVLGDGGVIVIQTNNATYGWTGQPEQQLAISQLRAVEHGRPVLIAATSGISGYITPDGNVHQETRQFTPAVVAADITPRTGLTLADRVGAWPEAAMAAAALVAWALAIRAGRRTAACGPADAFGGLSASRPRAGSGPDSPAEPTREGGGPGDPGPDAEPEPVPVPTGPAEPDAPAPDPREPVGAPSAAGAAPDPQTTARKAGT